MAAEVKFTVKKAIDDQLLTPASVSEELEQTFIKKARASSIKLIPVSFIVSAIVIGIIFLLVYFLNIFAISWIGFLCIIFPIFAIVDCFATSKAIKQKDYEFFYGEIAGKDDNGSYQIKGLDEFKMSPLFGKKDYNPGDKALVARIKNDLNIISEE